MNDGTDSTARFGVCAHGIDGASFNNSTGGIPRTGATVHRVDTTHRAGTTPLVWLLIDGLSWSLVGSRAHARPASTLTKSLERSTPMRAIRLMPLRPNCQTPPSLFSIFSGCDVTRHGLTGYLMPAPRPEAPLATANAFSIWPRDIPMIWDRWVDAGARCRLAAIPFVQPERLGEALLSHSAVYDGLAIAPTVLDDGAILSIPILGIDLRIEARDDAVWLYDRCAPRSTSPRRIALDTTAHLPVAPSPAGGNAFQAIALRSVQIDGKVKLISFGYRAVQQHTRNAQRPASSTHRAPSLTLSTATAVTSPSPARAYVAADPALLYRAGRLGIRLDDGGDGAAERLLLTLMRELHDSFAADIVAAVSAGDADATVGYYPVIDLLSHHLLKYLDPARTSPQAASIATALFDTALDWVDELIDRCVTAAPEPVCCIAHSDHGMTPIYEEVFPNYFFEQSGWLIYDDQGRPDIRRSSVLFHPAENGLLWWHPARLAATGVDLPIVIEQLRAALPARLAHGWQIFSGPPGACPDAGWCGEHYCQAPPGTRLLADRATRLLQPSRKGGDHAVHSDDAWLQGILVDVGANPVGLPDRPDMALADIAALVKDARIPRFVPATANAANAVEIAETADTAADTAAPSDFL